MICWALWGLAIANTLQKVATPYLHDFGFWVYISYVGCTLPTSSVFSVSMEGDFNLPFGRNRFFLIPYRIYAQQPKDIPLAHRYWTNPGSLVSTAAKPSESHCMGFPRPHRRKLKGVWAVQSRITTHYWDSLCSDVHVPHPAISQHNEIL